MRRAQQKQLALAGLMVVCVFVLVSRTGPQTSILTPQESATDDAPMVPTEEKSAESIEHIVINKLKRASLNFVPQLSHRQQVEIAERTVFPGVDAAHMHGRVGYAADGKPAWTPLPPMSSETIEEKKKHHVGTNFNLRRSDELPLDRAIADTRHAECRNLTYPEDLPVASVVFVFHDEALSTLYRSIHSVLNRTPPRYLKDIILIDDSSDVPHLNETLDNYLKLFPKVKLFRLPERSGLMKARTEGARQATGEVVIFLDSHIECNEGWIQPLLARIKEDRKHVVMPIIDSIDADSFEYRGGGIEVLAFSWSLGQVPLPRARPNNVGSWPSVIMAGGLFAMDRKLFFEIGAYDPEMQIWGGEESEISLRIWQCGMTLECMPCSHVGHIFRSHQYWTGHPYGLPGHIVNRNKLRVASVWMDEYKDIVFDILDPKHRVDIGPLDHMLELRKRLQCKPFQWFLDNVFPEMFIPTDPKAVRLRGEVRNAATDRCLDTLGVAKQTFGKPIGTWGCHGGKGNQYFILTHSGEIRAGGGYENCLDRSSSNIVSLWTCHGGGGNQKWLYDDATRTIRNGNNDGCMQVSKGSDSTFTLTMEKCTSNPDQVWVFHENDKRK